MNVRDWHIMLVEGLGEKLVCGSHGWGGLCSVGEQRGLRRESALVPPVGADAAVAEKKSPGAVLSPAKAAQSALHKQQAARARARPVGHPLKHVACAVRAGRWPMLGSPMSTGLTNCKATSWSMASCQLCTWSRHILALLILCNVFNVRTWTHFLQKQSSMQWQVLGHVLGHSVEVCSVCWCTAACDYYIGRKHCCHCKSETLC